MPSFNVTEVAQSRGWQPDEVRDLFTRYGIPARAAERSEEDWQRLERLLTEPPPFQLGDPLEVYFPHVDQWRGGFRYLEAHRNPEKIWLTDSRGIEHGSRLEWVRRATS
jgi:hypothetical protein